jgi:hypothetical protein
MLHPVKSRGLVEGTEFSITVRNCELGASPVYHHGVFRARFGIIIQPEMRFQDPGPFAKDLVRGTCVSPEALLQCHICCIMLP